MVLPTVDWVFPHQWIQLRQPPTDMPTDQLKPDSSSLRLASPVILGYVKVTIKAIHHSIKPGGARDIWVQPGLHETWRLFCFLLSAFSDTMWPYLGHCRLRYPHLGMDNTISSSGGGVVCTRAFELYNTDVLYSFVPTSEKCIIMGNMLLRWGASWKRKNHLRVINSVKLCSSTVSLCFPIYWIL